MTQQPKPKSDLPSQRVVLVTGPSGAGRSTAINALEDLEYEAIDNLPLSLCSRLITGDASARPLALGLDVRNRDFSTQGVLDLVTELSGRDDVDVDLLYLDCDPEVLTRRYSETRRRHPMAPEEAPIQGVMREVDLLKPLRARADSLLDTSNLSPHDLKAEMWRIFGGTAGGFLAVSLHSFSYKRGLPRGIDMVFDCRFLRNPYWDASLRELDGRTDQVQDYVAQDARYAGFFDKVQSMVEFLLPAYRDEGKTHFSIGFGCTGGKHRSVTMTEKLALALAEQEWQVSIRHRELERQTQ
ncbi:RNase adapter RapZ [Algirhabdus cladophorae]|uniref:RNase adapter RapZ n=1 Tax=Algirhabdus cladophorae TaxID=3377108 RepID=UPI003B847F9F